MKSITEILSCMQILLEISFDLQAGFEEYLTEDQRTFLAMLRVVEDMFQAPPKEVKIVYASGRAKLYKVLDGIPVHCRQKDTGWQRTERTQGRARERHQRDHGHELDRAVQSWYIELGR